MYISYAIDLTHRASGEFANQFIARLKLNGQTEERRAAPYRIYTVFTGQAVISRSFPRMLKLNACLPDIAGGMSSVLLKQLGTSSSGGEGSP